VGGEADRCNVTPKACHPVAAAASEFRLAGSGTLRVMADKPPEDPSRPSLELPSLRLPGLGAKRARQRQDEADATAGVEATAAVEASAPAPATAEESRPDEGTVRRSLPALPGRVAAMLTGLIVGLAGTGVTYLSLRGCEAVKGTESCGGTGLFALVAILLLMVLVGGILLKLWGLSEPNGTSFLAVGVLCVIVLVTLTDELFSAWMFLVVPLLGAAAYALAHWVTTRFVEPVERGPSHDVR
jgi:hypothetical protein